MRDVTTGMLVTSPVIRKDELTRAADDKKMFEICVRVSVVRTDPED